MPRNLTSRIERLEGRGNNALMALSDAELIDRIKGVYCQIRSHGVALPAWPSDDDPTPEYFEAVSEACQTF